MSQMLYPENGSKFGRLTVIKTGVSRRTGIKVPRLRPTVVVRCDCGCEKEVLVAAIKSGGTVSCGCFKSENQQFVARMSAKTTCFQQSHPDKQVWCGMFQRCYNPKNKRWPRYGGRGIEICERWNSFELFIADMGDRPSSEHSIDRIDNDGNYEPKNCRWATHKQQGRNTSKNNIHFYMGKNRSLVEISEMCGVPFATLWSRLKYGFDLKTATNPAPIKKKCRRISSLIPEIQRHLDEGVSTRAVAQSLGVSRSTVMKVARNER